MGYGQKISDWEAFHLRRQDGQRLKQYRREAEMTQRELGAALGVSQKTISTYETGQIPTPPKYLERAKRHAKIGQKKREELNALLLSLRKIREARGITQADVAEVLGVSRVGYSNYETGRTPIPLDALERVSAFLGSEDITPEAKPAPVADFSAPPPSPRPVYALPTIVPKERPRLTVTEAEESVEAVAVFEPAPPWRPSPWGRVKAAGARFLFRELRPFRALDVAVFLRLVKLSTLRPFLADLVSRGREGLAEGYGPAVISKHLAMLRDWMPTEPTITEESAAARYAARALGYIEEIDKAEKMTPEGLEELKADARSRNFSRGQRALDHYRGTVEYQIQRLKVIHSAGWKCSDCGVELTNTPNRPESAQWDHAHYHNPTEERQGVDAFAVCSACHAKRERARGRT